MKNIAILLTASVICLTASCSQQQQQQQTVNQPPVIKVQKGK